MAAIHDLCGYGKCSLGVAIPVLSAAGCDVCPVPTGLFSSHTAFPGWYMHDTTDILGDYLAAWAGIGVELDAVYSGFLGAPEQVDIIKQVWETYPKALRVVDPVMADHGKVYPTYTPELVEAMGTLANGADILTPNLTEAAIILGREWQGADVDEPTVREMILELRERGALGDCARGFVDVVATASSTTTCGATPSTSRKPPTPSCPTCCTARATCSRAPCSLR